MQMRKVLLVHISSSGCCNTFVTMLNNGGFWLSILFHFRVFSAPVIATCFAQHDSSHCDMGYADRALYTPKRTVAGSAVSWTTQVRLTSRCRHVVRQCNKHLETSHCRRQSVLGVQQRLSAYSTRHAHEEYVGH